MITYALSRLSRRELVATISLFAFSAALLMPIWRSGGRQDLTFLEFIINHTIWGEPVEYVPEEDYMAELSG